MKESQGVAIRAGGRRAKDEAGRGSPGFPWGLEKYLHTPSTFLPLYRPRDSSISASASPYSEVSPAEATFVDRASAFSSLHSIPYPSPLFSFISAGAPEFPYPSLFILLSLFLSLFSSSHEDDSHPLALFLAQCASENMNPSSHCLRQRFSNFPPLCTNDEGTKGEIKSRSQ